MPDKKRCANCDSTQTRFRLKTRDYQCYVCGHAWKDEIEEKEEDSE